MVVVTRLNLERASDGAPSLGIAASDVEDGNVEDGQLYDAALPSTVVGLGGLVCPTAAISKELVRTIVEAAAEVEPVAAESTRMVHFLEATQHPDLVHLVLTEAVEVVPARRPLVAERLAMRWRKREKVKKC